MRKSKIFTISIFLATTLSLATLVLVEGKGNVTSETSLKGESLRTLVKRCEVGLTQDKNCVANVVIGKAKNTGVITTIEELTKLEEEGVLKGNCHDLTHQLGSWASINQPKQALRANLNICGAGFLHGLMINHATTDGEESTDWVVQLCSSEKVVAMECLHGYGHALKAKNYSVENTVKLCSKVAEKSTRGLRKSNELLYDNIEFLSRVELCESGYLMERSQEERTPLKIEAMTSLCENEITTSIEEEILFARACLTYYNKQYSMERFNNDEEDNNKILNSFKVFCIKKEFTSKEKVALSASFLNFLDTLCWSELGSVLSSPYIINYGTGESVAEYLKIKETCSYTRTSLSICANSFITNELSQYGGDKEFYTGLCVFFKAEKLKNCVRRE